MLGTLFRFHFHKSDKPSDVKSDKQMSFIVGVNMACTAFIMITSCVDHNMLGWACWSNDKLLQMRMVPLYYYFLSGVFVGFGRQFSANVIITGITVSGADPARNLASIFTITATTALTANLLYNSAFENTWQVTSMNKVRAYVD